MDREETLARLRERIVAYAAYRLSRDAAEDIAQEVMLLLHQKYGHVNRLEDLLPLSIQIARLKIIGAQRKAYRRGEHAQVPVDEARLSDSSLNPGAEFEKKEMLDRLKAAIDKLEARCREMFRLKLQGKTFSEIQKTMGVRSINTIYTWDFRCRKHLLELMGGDWEARS